MPFLPPKRICNLLPYRFLSNREHLRLVLRISTPEEATQNSLDYIGYPTPCRTGGIIKDEHSATSCASPSFIHRRRSSLLPFDHERQLERLDGSGIKDFTTLLLQTKDGDLSSIGAAAQLATTRVIDAISARVFLLAVTVTPLQSTFDMAEC